MWPWKKKVVVEEKQPLTFTEKQEVLVKLLKNITKWDVGDRSRFDEQLPWYVKCYINDEAVFIDRGTGCEEHTYQVTVGISPRVELLCDHPSLEGIFKRAVETYYDVDINEVWKKLDI